MPISAAKDQVNNGSQTFDVAVVGSGICGTLAASVLGRTGFSVCLIDRHAVYPPDFRAEHLDGPQVEQLRRLGFLDPLTEGLYRGETVALARAGRVIGTGRTLNFGLGYDTLVNRARLTLSPNVQRMTARAVDIEASDTLQRIATSDGGFVTARLVIVATGQGYALCKRLGIRRPVLREAHSLTFGFNVEPAGHGAFEHPFLVYQRERIADRIDYLAAFSFNATTRVNLFTYRDYREPWTKAFIADPRAGLEQALPGLASVMGPYHAVGPVVARPMDVYVSDGHRRDGVVLIGDAFQGSCPATGQGMHRLLTDTEQLCSVHVPRWLGTAGMGAKKIVAFYDDPVKRACDAQALHDAEYRRSLSTDDSLRWRLHRRRVQTMELLNGWRHRPLTASQAPVHQDPAEASLAPG